MAARSLTKALKSRALAIKLAVFDVDGVLTDGSLYFSDSGEQLKAFNVLDGHGLRMLQQSGIEVALITSRTSRVVELRAQDLGISHLYQGTGDKLLTYSGLLEMLGLSPNESCYMGDDVVDLPILRRCGLAVTVPDAPEAVKQHCHYVTKRAGGRGAAREFCDLLMQSQGTLEHALEAYLR